MSLIDVVCAAASPVLALAIRDTTLLTGDRKDAAAIYILFAFGFSAFSFLIFRIREGMTHHFSVDDALDVAKAVMLSELLTTVALFAITRLDGIPRSTPIIHALLLGAGLVAARTLIRVRTGRHRFDRTASATEHIIVIGSTQLSALYIKLIQTALPGHHRVTAVLDDDHKRLGRSSCGARIVGSPQHLEPMIEELAVHGIRTDRVIVGGERSSYPAEVMHDVERLCEQRGIMLGFVPDLVGLPPLHDALTVEAPSDPHSAEVHSRYFRFRRFVDFVVSILLLICLLPIFLIVSIVVFLDVGSPVFFWQQRMGQGRRVFLLHKFRTLRPSFDWQGKPVPEDERLSTVGQILRRCRLDELPQLLNVLVGDMALIGPRPLLPADQPANPSTRLAVRPGITGWAQVNGGTSLAPEAKNDLDEWYVRNASVKLDALILLKTFSFLYTGEREIVANPSIASPRSVQSTAKASPPGTSEDERAHHAAKQEALDPASLHRK